MNPFTFALAISLIANAALGYAYLGQRDDTAAAKSARDTAQSAADTCSKSVDDLQQKASTRAKDATQARTKAAAVAKTRDQLADMILSTPASSPDDCTAATQRASKWLATRK